MLSPQSLSIEPPPRDRITAISSAVQRKPIVLVLGMHRSGTSLCSHILSALGVDMADKISPPGSAAPASDNPRGHWERWEIVEFHDRILSLFNRDYFGRFHDFALPVAWWADPRVAQIRREIIAFLEQRMGESYFGFKDPRTVRLMPIWHQIFGELKLAPKLVLCLRNPAQIGRSLNARESLDPEIGEYRWLIYMVDFFRYVSKYEFCTIEYKKWFSDPLVNIEKLQRFLDLPWQQSKTDLSLVLSGIIELALRHDDSDYREASQPLVRTLYTLAGSDRENGARDQIAHIVSQFVSFQQLQKPLLGVFEELAKTAAKYPEIEQEVAALRTAVSERDMIVEAANARAVAIEARLGDALAELDQQRTQIAEVARERDEASGLNATLADREAALVNLSNRVEELRAELQVAQAEVAAHEAALQRAEAEAQQCSAATRAMESEIAALRDAVTKAECQAQKCTAAQGALQSEIMALRGKLDVARQTGRAIIAGSRADALSPTKLDGRRGWRHAVMRLMRREPCVIIARADHARDAGQWELAAQLYREALDQNPRNPPIWVQYGHAVKESGGLRAPDKLSQAEAAYRKALSLDQDAADTHLHLGHVLKLQGRTHEAEASYLRVVARDPSMSDAMRELSELGWSEAQLSELRSMLD
jgi:hypothetical protein